ncbi:lipopolysaccharide assembly protein LapA domain-containing protein [Terrilactibacillus sp. S3-3]|nr:lipopolysaccharide assembly protein LapA domain-containing protein [Terrilactibacillus sp. S3-3]
MKRQWALLFALVFILIIVLFSIANVDIVTVSFLVGKTRMPLILVIVVSVLFGALIIGSVSYRKMIQLQRALQHSENERKKKLQLELQRRTADESLSDTGKGEKEDEEKKNSEPEMPEMRRSRRSRR